MLADIRANGELTRARASAMDGNVQLAAEVRLDETREIVVALGFGGTPDHAAQQGRASLAATFATARRLYVRGWQRIHRDVTLGDRTRGRRTQAVFDTSVTTLRVHQDKERVGAIIASMAIPWGNAHGDQHAGGYHLVWPRDLVESAGALLAVGHAASARRTLEYLVSTQEHDGVWPQNMWLDGTPHLRGVQLDEVALPILLAAMLRRHDALADIDPWPMIRSAIGYIVRTGPATPEDRWEEEGGYSPYTVAAEIAALLAAATFADSEGEVSLAEYLRETADEWLAFVDRWMYVRGTPLAERYGVDGYYVRLTPPAAIVDGERPIPGTRMRLVNQPCADAEMPYDEIVSPDALALVRFGLRSADDPRIRDTIKVIDGELRVVTTRGPAWRRFTADGYGEPRDGSPHLGSGVGRAWPLLTGER
ncbi:MAG: glycoside hydrolase family 15 protein, partial [Gemmatimonadaceae bacterium]